jgi:hypothetical protein
VAFDELKQQVEPFLGCEIRRGRAAPRTPGSPHVTARARRALVRVRAEQHVAPFRGGTVDLELIGGTQSRTS